LQEDQQRAQAEAANHLERGATPEHAMRDDLDKLVATAAAAHGFSGAIQVTLDRATALTEAFGEADRSTGIRNTVDTRFGIASGTKFPTALAAGALIDDGVLALDDRLVDVVSVPLPGSRRASRSATC
jgi:CubicO group peptidase (beta-lactamase class C family)